MVHKNKELGREDTRDIRVQVQAQVFIHTGFQESPAPKNSLPSQSTTIQQNEYLSHSQQCKVIYFTMRCPVVNELREVYAAEALPIRFLGKMTLPELVWEHCQKLQIDPKSSMINF